MDVKVGDIFYINCGITSFYQVIKVYDNGKVRVRKIEKVEKPIGGVKFWAKPLKNKFYPRKQNVSAYEKSQMDILDNDKGTIKTIKEYWDGKPCIKFKGDRYAVLYEGEKVVSDHWGALMR